MTSSRPYAVTVGIEARDDVRVLLSLASVLHRRGIGVSQANLSPPSLGRRTFTAVFTATNRQAVTLQASLSRLIEVVEVVLVEAGEGPKLGQSPDSVP